MLGNPEKTLPRVVHVAGTNGKGSVVAFLKSICEAAGYVVHSYTSPHLVRFAERISVAGSTLKDEELVAILEECEAANNEQPITFFEIATAAAYLAFSRKEADVTLIETGLGGRFDATNVFDQPALTAITPISMDHMNYLGDTIEKIAFEKAGILKQNALAVIGPQSDNVSEVLRKRANKVSAPIFQYGSDWHITTSEDGFRLFDKNAAIPLPEPKLPGPHQFINAGIAAICAQNLPGLSIPNNALAHGLRSVYWPGRLQKLDKGRLVNSLPPSWEIWLDGGHNAAAANALAKTVSHWSDRPLHLIFGALAARAPQEFLAPLVRDADYLHAIAIPGESTTLDADVAASAAQKAGHKALPAASVDAALETIAKMEKRPGRVLICGSLYLVGAVLVQNETPP